jgi:TetR/AcrR family transcriptional regulator, transcriptional repressor of bet genes
VPKRVDHSARRREILDAVARITVRGGLSAATFREVAAEAGVSVRLVQYYFGTKADLLHAANADVAEQVGARVLARALELGGDAHPRVLVREVFDEFMPFDETRKQALLLFFAFYTAQMTEVALARSDASAVARNLAAFIARQIRRAQELGSAPVDIDADLEGALLASAMPSVASAIVVGYLSRDEANTILDYTLDRLLGQSPEPSVAERVSRGAAREGAERPRRRSRQ